LKGENFVEQDLMCDLKLNFCYLRGGKCSMQVLISGEIINQLLTMNMAMVIKFYSRGDKPVKEQEPHFLLYYRKESHHTHVHT